jgi:hypothetical protein
MPLARYSGSQDEKLIYPWSPGKKGKVKSKDETVK